MSHDAGQQRGGLGISGKPPDIGQGRAGPPARDAAHISDFLRGINPAFQQDGSETKDPQRKTFRLQLIQAVSRSMPCQHGTAGGNMVQTDMPYFMGNGPADFILRGAVIVADNEGLRRFAPQYKAVFVIVRLQIGGAFLNPCRKCRVAKNQPSILGGMAQGLTGSADMPCSSRKAIAAASKMVSLYIPSLFSAAGNVLLKRSAASARPEVSPPRAAKGNACSRSYSARNSLYAVSSVVSVSIRLRT